MSKKSVVIALPPRVLKDPAGETPEADGWVNAAPPEAAATSGTPGLIDLRADRSPLELAWLIWTFPALATLHWMAKVVGQPRPR